MVKDFVLPVVAGRLGNNLFMVANAYSKARTYSKELYLCKPQFHQEYVESIFKDFKFINSYQENHNYNLEVPSDDTYTLYSGYFQSEVYFEKYSDDIKKLFGPPIEFIEKIKKEIPVLFEKKITVINVRRGDYLNYPSYHPTVSKDYIYQALKLVPSEQYLIASDDIEWCKENINLENSIYLEGYKGYEQMWILSLCHYFIISNSSFSWWAAYLSEHENKIVVAPETWYGPDGPKYWEEIYCKDWIKLPTHFKNGMIYPTLTNEI